MSRFFSAHPKPYPQSARLACGQAANIVRRMTKRFLVEHTFQLLGAQRACSDQVGTRAATVKRTKLPGRWVRGRERTLSAA